MLRILKNQKGFTLIELVIIIILIGVLAAVAIPKYVDLRDNAARAASQATLDAGRAGVTLNFAQQILNDGGYVSPFSATGLLSLAEAAAVEAYLEASPSYPSAGSYGTGTDGNFRWYVVAVGSTTLAAAPVPPELSGVLDTTCDTADTLPTGGTANEDCDVRQF